MALSFLNYMITAAMGFAIGGVLMSGHFLVTGKPLGFAMEPGRPALVPLHILLRMVAGPSILIRNIFTMEDDSFSLAAAGVFIAAVWSLGCGALLFQAI